MVFTIETFRVLVADRLLHGRGPELLPVQVAVPVETFPVLALGQPEEADSDQDSSATREVVEDSGQGEREGRQLPRQLILASPQQGAAPFE